MDVTTEAYSHTSNGELGAEVVLYLANGDVDAFEYREWLRRYYNRDVGIIIEFPLHRLTIEGINMKDLFLGLVSRSISQLHERHKEQDAIEVGEVYISKIIIENFVKR